jgi:hypothetical protein
MAARKIASTSSASRCASAMVSGPSVNSWRANLRTHGNGVPDWRGGFGLDKGAMADGPFGGRPGQHTRAGPRSTPGPLDEKSGGLVERLHLDGTRSSLGRPDVASPKQIEADDFAEMRPHRLAQELGES